MAALWARRQTRSIRIAAACRPEHGSQPRLCGAHIHNCSMAISHNGLAPTDDVVADMTVERSRGPRGLWIWEIPKRMQTLAGSRRCGCDINATAGGKSHRTARIQRVSRVPLVDRFRFLWLNRRRAVALSRPGE